ncbi:MAG: hypothetical protein JXB47_13540 [Anaerolineae bacterium]|nr:hypothetical protein [Anaerolineae bacterium]
MTYVKTEEERRVERMTLGAMLVLLGVDFLIHLPSGVFPFLAAAILLGSALYQRSRGWEVSFWTWLFGGLFALSIVADLIGAAIGFVFTWWPLILIGLGVIMLLNLRER